MISDEYHTSLLFTGLLLVLVVVQWMVATIAKAKTGALPGQPPKIETHDQFAFRAYRTHQNTLENLGTILGGAFFAILAGATNTVVAWLLGIIFVSRVVHMALYYKIATEQNPSPRSYFFMISWFANIVLIVVAFVALF
ncbi:hypothetical protein P9112_008252 [Eukaryota sp. TZLM1-RC]